MKIPGNSFALIEIDSGNVFRCENLEYRMNIFNGLCFIAETETVVAYGNTSFVKTTITSKHHFDICQWNKNT